MNNKTILFFVFCFLHLQAYSEENMPAIVCDEPVCSFGSVTGLNKKVTHNFIIKNNGNADLVVKKIRACCGGSGDIKNETIKPGTNTTLSTSLFLGSRKGDFKKSFYLITNDPRQPYFQLRFTGKILMEQNNQPINVDPAGLDFGVIREDVDIIRNISITASSGTTFNITNVACSSPRFHVALNAEAHGSSYVVTVAPTLPLETGMLNGSILIKTDNKEMPEIKVPVKGRVFSDIVVVPLEIVIKTDKIEPIKRFVALRSRTDTPFRILDIRSPEKDITTEVKSLDASDHRVYMENIMPFPDLDGKELVIKTDHKDVKEIRIPFRVEEK